MNGNLRNLSQQFLTAAWNTARTHTSRDQAHRLEELLTVLDETQAQIAGLRLHLIHEARLSNIDTVTDHIRTSTRTTTAQATATLKLSWDLAERFGHIARALENGVVSLAQAEAIVAGLKKLPNTLTRTDLETAQATVLGYVDALGPKELQTLASRMVEIIDPTGAEQTEAERLAAEERRAHAGRFFKLRPDQHGSLTLTGRLPVAAAATLTAQLEALMPPLSSYRGGDELPTPDARRADALVLLAETAASTGEVPAHGFDRPAAKITIPLATLTDRLGPAAVLDDGQPISAGEARRLACDADIIPIVLGPKSEILDIGRSQRLFTKALRLALIARDQGCAFPHCDTTAAVCEGHHIVPWHHGGQTALSNGVLLCPHHHRLVEPDPRQSEHSQWRVFLDKETGRPWFTPPRHIDPARRPRQHRRFLLNDITLTEPDDNPHDTGPPRSYGNGPSSLYNGAPSSPYGSGPPSEAPPCPHDDVDPWPHTRPAAQTPNPWHAEEDTGAEPVA
ncbi:MAG: DUF222 domain-containing protein [Tessaracoccus sp.]|uniref:HNH endonuclease signature motif containing protein n=1 Tax=Tessaracoccus sp. TaxID=1971211 RepID=UPI001EBE8F94|nr:HNH endonuclease signature motif containing protein [Tessaracoccus sp.]MBK7819765.1 DUF222 domain-containing protein [Tessaracoccus sp.]